MKRTIRRELMDNWLSRNRPDAIRALAKISKIPSASLSKIRCGRVPMSELQRISLAKALGVSERKLFPVLQDEEGQAS